MNVHLDIVTPERSVFSEDVTHVLIPGWNGQFGVLAEHDLFLSLLRGGVLTVNPGADQRRFVIGRGFVEVGSNRVTVLTDSCVSEQDVVSEGVQARIDALGEQINGLPFGAPETEGLLEQLEIAQAIAAL